MPAISEVNHLLRRFQRRRLSRSGQKRILEAILNFQVMKKRQPERRIQRLEQMQLILRSAKVTDRSRMTVFPAAGRIFHQSSVLSRRILLWTVFILVMLSQILLLVRS